VATFDDGSFAVALAYSDDLTHAEGPAAETTLAHNEDTDIALARFSKDGALQWAVAVAGEGIDLPGALAALPDGSLLLAGTLEQNLVFVEPSGPLNVVSRGGADGFVARFDQSGQFLWVRTLSGTDDQRVADLAGLSDGSCVLAGTFVNDVTFDVGLPTEQTVIGAAAEDVVVARLDPDGDVVWITEAVGSERDVASSIDVFDDGSCVIAGTYSESLVLAPRTIRPAVLPLNALFDPWVARIDPDGNAVWAAAGTGGNTIRPNPPPCVAAGSDGSCLVAGVYDLDLTWNTGLPSEVTLPPATTVDPFVVRFDEAGAALEAQAFTGAGTDFVYDLAALRDGSWIVLGGLRQDLTFGAGTPAEVALRSAGKEDVFVTRLTREGAVVWAVGAGGNEDDSGSVLSLRPDGAVLLAGEFSDALAFDAGLPTAQAVASKGKVDAFVARLNADGRL
jgi:hypothetical protein